MLKTNFNEVTLENILACGYELMIADCGSNIAEYDAVLSSASLKASNANDTVVANALGLLSLACSPFLMSSNPREPFSAKITLGDRRSVMPQDFPPEQGALFSALAPVVVDAELAARVGDLAWIIIRDVNAANIAINNYIGASSSQYCLDNWYERVSRLERGLRLAFLIKATDQIEVIKKKLIESLDPSNEAYNFLASERICGILLDLKEDPILIAEKALLLASEADRCAHYDLKCSLLYIACDGFSKGKDLGRARDAQIEAAETLVQKFNFAKESGEMISAAHWLKGAITAFQKCKGQHARVIVLQGELPNIIKGSFKEMNRISSPPVDLTEIAHKTILMIQGKSLIDTLISFSFISKPLSRKDLENSVIETLKMSPIQFLAAKSMYNRYGRVVAIVPPLLGSEGDDYELAMRSACYERAGHYYSMIVHGIIYPARDGVLRLHQINESAIFKVLQHSTFLPVDRLSIWVKGILAGFDGDFDVALSVLIPQFEHAFRKALEAKGELVWRIDSSTQFHSEMSLNELFKFPGALSLCGEDLHFELQGLLLERFGGNFRNECAHGLMSEQEFYSPKAIYLWWLLFRIAVCSSLASLKPETANVGDGKVELEEV